MPVGSPVTAARGGRVVAIEERFVDFTRKGGEENYVVIDHGDSTFARYYHLTKDGALVEVGATVAPGDTIGRSGSTGASAGPHLHFDVTRGCFPWGCQTIETRFSNASPDSMASGVTYRAMPSP
jgi:murein DD-endopeptidase MepM/ murein hydrolase activator NlpD